MTMAGQFTAYTTTWMAAWAAGWGVRLALVRPAGAENAGWREYFKEDPTEFHNLPLAWEAGGGTVPAWLGGTYVRCSLPSPSSPASQERTGAAQF
jgi:hypothetical protein